jgi:hypothetical protein
MLFARGHDVPVVAVMHRGHHARKESRRARRKPRTMTIGFGLFLIAVGAILRFAVTATVAGVDIQTVGVILMVVGAIAFVISLVFEFNRRSGRQPPPPPPPPTAGY